ncbi:MAG: hypothetical protein WD042_07755 [Phycisphaeraceae bacterium]
MPLRHNHLPRMIALVALIALAGVLVGCQSAPQWQPSRDRAPQPDVPGRQTALVLEHGRDISNALSPPGTLAWYDVRNDAVLTTYAGYRGPVADTTVTFTHDHQSSSGGRVFDHYHSTTYRVQVQQSVR